MVTNGLYVTVCALSILQPALAMYWRFAFTTVKEESYGALTVHHLVKEPDRPA